MEVTAICRPVVTGCCSISAVAVVSATSRAAEEDTVRRTARRARALNGSPRRGPRPAAASFLSTTGRESGVARGERARGAGACWG